MIQLDLIAGPNQGASFNADERSFMIGRGRTNRIVLLDDKVSARHAQIESRAQDYILRDLNSTNGTFVNGLAITETPLKLGDEIRIGQSVLRVAAMRLGIPSYPGRISLTDTGPAAPVRLRLRPPDPLPVLEHARDQTTLPTLAEAYRNLLAMYKVSSIIHGDADLEKLLDDVLAQVFRSLRAERGVIMLLDDETGELVPTAFRSREPDPSQAELTLSRTILHEVVEKQEAILTSDATLDERFNPAASVMEQHIRSAMCSPLSVKGRVLGIVYVDCRSRAGSFKKADLELLSAIANEAGVAVENRMLRDANIKAQRLAAIGQTVANLSHYIKNILTCMTAGSDIVSDALAQGGLAAAQKGWGIVSRNERKISDLVLDMLNYSAERRPARRTCDLRDIIEDVLQTARPALDDANIQVVLQLDPNLPEAFVDPAGVQRCLFNLLTNAMDAVAGRDGAAITIATARDRQSAVIRVADNGPGIPSDIQARIFDVFFTTKGDRGTGLGLAVVRKIVHEHAGEVSVTSTPGQGAEFRILLPINPTHAPDAT